MRAANPAGHFCRLLGVDAFRQLERLCRSIVNAGADPPRHNAGLSFLLLEAWHLYQNSNAEPDGQALHPAVERLAQSLSEARREEQFHALARRAGLSASRLGRLFKQQTGVSVSDYRNQLRVRQFMELYGAGQRVTMLRAALSAGFGSYTQFHRVFTRIAGRTPRAYQREVKQNRYARRLTTFE